MLRRSYKPHYYRGVCCLKGQQLRLEQAKESLVVARKINAGKDALADEKIDEGMGALKRAQWEQEEAVLESKILGALDKASQVLSEKMDAAAMQLGDTDTDTEEGDSTDLAEHLRQIDGLRAREQGRAAGRVLPDWLCCRITFDIMRDPVLTPDGITYERSVILLHLKTNGRCEPSTDTHSGQQGASTAVDRCGWPRCSL